MLCAGEILKCQVAFVNWCCVVLCGPFNEVHACPVSTVISRLSIYPCPFNLGGGQELI